MSRTPEQTAMLRREHGWVPGEKCRRKGGSSMITYYVADTSEDGVLLQVVKGGRRVGDGKWYSWKTMEMDFACSTKSLSKLSWYGNKGN